jgi:polysaccharide pyruvyl transferase WcaK-like protein
MNLETVFKKENLNKSLIIGWYGGGNFGDELLLAILLNLLKLNDFKDLNYVYLDDKVRDLLSQNYDYAKPVVGKAELIRTILKSRNIIIGGGGHWGQDMNKNVLIMTLILFLSHYILRKNVYLLGVGFYNSTNKLGRLSAWFAAKSAKYILARDKESCENFRKYSDSTYLDKDIAFSLPSLFDSLPKSNSEEILSDIKFSNGKSILISLRHMRGDRGNAYVKAVEEFIASNPKVNFILMILEPRDKDTNNYNLVVDISKKYSNVSVTDFNFNPLTFVLYLKKDSEKILMIAPQYHAQLIAHLVGIKHFPIVYDNKVKELLTEFEMYDTVAIEDVKTEHFQDFLSKYY